MKSIGSILFFYGLVAIIMNFFNMVPRLLIWIYNWGEGTAWAIKIAFVIVGGAIWLLASKNDTKDVVEEDTTTNQPTQP